MIREKVFLGRDNSIDVRLYADNLPVNLSGVTKIELVEVNASFTISSADYPSVFSWTGLGVTGKVVISLGDNSNELTAGNTYNCRIVIYDAVYTDGLEWETIVQIEVI